MSQRKPKLQWPEILAKLHLGGMTLTRLGQDNDIFFGSITCVKSQIHYKAQQAIADFIGEVDIGNAGIALQDAQDTAVGFVERDRHFKLKIAF